MDRADSMLSTFPRAQFPPQAVCQPPSVCRPRLTCCSTASRLFVPTKPTKIISWQPCAFSLELMGRHLTATRTLEDSPLAIAAAGAVRAALATWFSGGMSGELGMGGPYSGVDYLSPKSFSLQFRTPLPLPLVILHAAAVVCSGRPGRLRRHSIQPVPPDRFQGPPPPNSSLSVSPIFFCRYSRVLYEVNFPAKPMGACAATP